jgi:radical SAM/Cys-rich protein
MRSESNTQTANAFDERLRAARLAPLHANELTTLQVNVGKRCNQACRHCHVDAGPHRTAAADNMGAEVAAHIVRVLRAGGFHTLDLTGGAPELNPYFRELVLVGRELGMRVIDRCNLSVLFEPGQEDLADFLADNRVEITASLPYYSAGPTDRQRGTGVFDKSIAGLRLLNERGYGNGRSGLVLNLVYNPAGAFLPGDQRELEADFQRALASRFAIRFDHLFCITNMPIARYREWLERSDNLDRYLQMLADAFNPAAVEGLMCRNLVSIAPDGTIHDCDFNQMCGLPVDADVPRNIRDFDHALLASRPIVTDTHCLGCTAGAGSSCGGQVAGEDG